MIFHLKLGWHSSTHFAANQKLNLHFFEIFFSKNLFFLFSSVIWWMTWTRVCSVCVCVLKARYNVWEGLSFLPPWNALFCVSSALICTWPALFSHLIALFCNLNALFCSWNVLFYNKTPFSEVGPSLPSVTNFLTPLNPWTYKQYTWYGPQYTWYVTWRTTCNTSRDVPHIIRHVTYHI